MRSVTTKDNEKTDDFVFRFRIDELPRPEPVYRDRLVELVRAQLEEILKVARLSVNGEVVDVDGFAFMNEESQIYRIYRPDSEESPRS
jgi:hypothetical protein